jgi:hypothetical protein
MHDDWKPGVARDDELGLEQLLLAVLVVRLVQQNRKRQAVA